MTKAEVWPIAGVYVQGGCGKQAPNLVRRTGRNHMESQSGVVPHKIHTEKGHKGYRCVIS